MPMTRVKAEVFVDRMDEPVTSKEANLLSPEEWTDTMNDPNGRAWKSFMAWVQGRTDQFMEASGFKIEITSEWTERSQ